MVKTDNKDISWNETLEWSNKDTKTKQASKTGNNYIFYIVIAIVIFIILYVIYMFWRSDDKPNTEILDSIIDPKNSIPLKEVATPYPQSPIVGMSPKHSSINQGRSYGSMSRSSPQFQPNTTPSSIHNQNYSPATQSHSFDRSHNPNYPMPSPGGKSIISPNGRLYPAVGKDGTQSGWWLHPNK